MRGWFKGLLAGCGLSVLVQGVWLTTMGVSISVSPATVAAGMTQSLKGLNRKDLTSRLEDGMAPVMNRSMAHLVQTVHVQVDGITLGINPANEYHLQHQLIHDMNTSVAGYLNRQLKSSTMTLNLMRALRSHPENIRIRASWGFLSIPVHIRIP
ncbi:MAG: hypothetical protein M1596_00930 [Firmicutes bacterium]|nr:hypothetical protein [Bacillota bacterium]